MATKQRMRLTDSHIARLRPYVREYTVWDTRLAGLGVRVRPSGGASFVFLRKVEGRSRRLSLGRSPRTSSTTCAADAMPSWRNRNPKPGMCRRIRRCCSATSWQGPGRTPTFSFTSPPTERASAVRSTVSSCPPSVQRRSITSPASRCCAGSTPTVNPHRAAPTPRSMSFAVS